MLGSWEKGAENSNQNENLDSSEYQNLTLESPQANPLSQDNDAPSFSSSVQWGRLDQSCL